MLTARPVSVPPVVVISAAAKPVGTSEKAKLMVAVWPAPRVLVLLLIETVGPTVSTVAVTAGEVVRVLPAVSMILALKECSPLARAAVM